MNKVQPTPAVEHHLQVDIVIDPKNVTAFLAGMSGVGISLGGNVGLVCRD